MNFAPFPSFLLLASIFCLGSATRAQVAAPPPGTGTEAAQPAESRQGPLSEAETDLDRQQYSGAAKLLGIYLSAHPQDARALFDLGYAEDAQGHIDAAESDYRKAVAVDPKQFESHLALGLLLLNRNAPGAREQLEAAAQLDPDPPNPAAKAQAYRALARLLVKSDPDEAGDALVKALQATPETPADTLLAAEIAEAAGSDDLAEQAYRRVLQVQPENSAATAGLVHILLAEKKYSDAEPLVRSALARDPDDPALNAQLAAILNAEGKQTEAVSALEKLHQLQPADQNVGRMLADAYTQAGDLDKASAIYELLLHSSPRDPSLLDANGQILIRQQKFDAALAAFQQAVQLKPDDVDAWSGIAFACSETHQYRRELDALAQRARYAPDTPATFFLWATAYDSLHQTKQAAEYYRKFLAAAQGKFPDQEWQAKHRLIALGK